MAIPKTYSVLIAAFILVVSYRNVVSKPLFTNGVIEMNMQNEPNDSYMVAREKIILSEQHEGIGGELVLSADEVLANAVLMRAKEKEINGSHKDGKPFAPSINFLLSKELIEQSDVFKIIQKMPKGAALHLHDSSMCDVMWLVQNATYRDNCYMCTNGDGMILFQFFRIPPPNPDCPWKMVKLERAASANVTKFDSMLYESMTLTSATLNEDLNKVWKRFGEIFQTVNGLLNYEPVFGDYYYEALDEFNQDNVQHLEFRGLLPQVYELDGTTHDSTYTMQIYKNVTDRYLAEHPEFTGAKVIKSNLRFRSPEEILDDIKFTIQLMKQFPGFLVGYDLVGQEDPLNPLIFYLDALRYPSQQTPPIKFPYFFHAGETDWQGTQVDDNLIDAVLLNTSRIGHGYALTKHPEVMKMVKTNQIAIEVNPISNQVLKLVDNLQNHPMADLIAQNFPVVISADDPGIWSARGLSYDFYMAFMGMSGEEDDLKLLKQLAMNSLVYSAMSDTEKVAALKVWEQKWAVFIRDLVTLA